MAEYIERDKALREIDHSLNLSEAYSKIAEIPAADVVEVVHGRWIEYLDFWRKCSECEASWHEQWIFGKHMHYCSNCGAKMDG